MLARVSTWLGWRIPPGFPTAKAERSSSSGNPNSADDPSDCHRRSAPAAQRLAEGHHDLGPPRDQLVTADDILRSRDGDRHQWGPRAAGDEAGTWLRAQQPGVLGPMSFREQNNGRALLQQVERAPQ